MGVMDVNGCINQQTSLGGPHLIKSNAFEDQLSYFPLITGYNKSRDRSCFFSITLP